MKHTTKVHKHIHFLIVGLLLIGTTACSKCKKEDKKSITSIDDSMIDAVSAGLTGSDQEFMVGLLTKLKEGEKVDINTANTDSEDWTPLHYAARIGYGPLMDALIEREAKINATCKPYNETPLHIATRYQHTNCVEKLLKTSDIDVNAEDKDGEPPLYQALNKRDVKMVKLLLNHPNIDVNKKIKSIGRTVLKEAEYDKNTTTDAIDKAKLEGIITALKAKGATT